MVYVLYFPNEWDNCRSIIGVFSSLERVNSLLGKYKERVYKCNEEPGLYDDGLEDYWLSDKYKQHEEALEESTATYHLMPFEDYHNHRRWTTVLTEDKTGRIVWEPAMDFCVVEAPSDVDVRLHDWSHYENWDVCE